MSKEAVQAFRQVLHNEPALQAEFGAAFQRGPAAVVSMAASHGFDFTESEYVEEAERVSAAGELTDEEMEMVSAGGSSSANVPPTSTTPRSLGDGGVTDSSGKI